MLIEVEGEVVVILLIGIITHGFNLICEEKQRTELFLPVFAVFPIVMEQSMQKHWWIGSECGLRGLDLVFSEDCLFAQMGLGWLLLFEKRCVWVFSILWFLLLIVVDNSLVEEMRVLAFVLEAMPHLEEVQPWIGVLYMN